jgi:ribosomal protein L20
LNGSNALHQKIYQFIELCNFNQSNKDRNEEAEAFFYRVDNKKDAMEERILRKLIVKAVNAALELDDVKAKEAAMAVGIDAETIEEIRNLLEDYAEQNPEEFLEIIERASLANETLLKDAVKAGFIKNNVNSSQFEWTETGKEIYKYKKAPNKNYYKELADYLESENPEELNAIRTRLG